MPFIDIKTTQKLTQDQKIILTERLTKAFGDASSPDCASNIQYAVEDGLFMNFHGDYKSPTTHVYIHTGYLTPESDYENVVKAFYPVLTEILDSKQDRIYISIDEVRAWGFNNVYVPPKT